MHKTAFKVQAIRLNEVRPFVFDHIELGKVTIPNAADGGNTQISLDARNNKQLEDFVIQRTEKLLQKVTGENNR